MRFLPLGIFDALGRRAPTGFARDAFEIVVVARPHRRQPAAHEGPGRQEPGRHRAQRQQAVAGVVFLVGLVLMRSGSDESVRDRRRTGEQRRAEGEEAGRREGGEERQCALGTVGQVPI